MYATCKIFSEFPCFLCLAGCICFSLQWLVDIFILVWACSQTVCIFKKLMSLTINSCHFKQRKGIQWYQSFVEFSSPLECLFWLQHFFRVPISHIILLCTPPSLSSYFYLPEAPWRLCLKATRRLRRVRCFVGPGERWVSDPLHWEDTGTERTWPQFPAPRPGRSAFGKWARSADGGSCYPHPLPHWQRPLRPPPSQLP